VTELETNNDLTDITEIDVREGLHRETGAPEAVAAAVASLMLEKITD